MTSQSLMQLVSAGNEDYRPQLLELIEQYRNDSNPDFAKFDLTSQISRTHQVKTGFEIKNHEIDYSEVTRRPSTADFSFNRFTSDPIMRNYVVFGDNIKFYCDAFFE